MGVGGSKIEIYPYPKDLKDLKDRLLCALSFSIFGVELYCPKNTNELEAKDLKDPKEQKSQSFECSESFVSFVSNSTYQKDTSDLEDPKNSKDQKDPEDPKDQFFECSEFFVSLASIFASGKNLKDQKHQKDPKDSSIYLSLWYILYQNLNLYYWSAKGEGGLGIQP